MTPHRFMLVAIALVLGLAGAADARQLAVSGRLEVVQVDDFDHGQSRVIHRVRDDRTGREYELDDVAPGLRHGMRVRAQGRVKRGVRRDGARVLTAPAGGELSLTVLDAAMPAAALVAGGRKALTMVVDFSQDGKTVACTDAAIAGTMFSGNPSVDKLYQETSFGQLSWPADTNGNGAPDVVRVTINDAGNDCDTTTWRSLADAAATAAGMNLGLYQHRVYVLPSTVGCQWAGYAQIGCGSACWAMIATCDRGDVYAHELGHNLGMWHASFDADGNGAVDPTCPWGSWSGGGEYCDDSDFMGISTNVWRQTNGPHKHQMGWIPANKVVDVAAGGTYAVAPLETDPATTSLPLLLRVARPAPASGYYYLSYRRRVGYDAGMRSSYADRTNIHTSPGGNTLLVSFIGDGQTFADSSNALTISQVSHDATAAQIAVAMSCGNGVIDAGEECDGANIGSASCGGCAGTPVCTTSCRLDASACTNGVCDATETCASCPADCVGAGAVCGNGICEAGNDESCVTCPSDCNGQQSGKPSARYCCGFAGANPVGCNANLCGACTPLATSVCCGDGTCTGDETSATCLRDCQPCTDADGDGYCPSQGDCNDANPNVRPNAPEVCSGGVDENCNGLTDCNDPGCNSSPSCTTCLPLGASCTQSGQCCSLSCSGKPNRKTCK
jgi:hypothetical protein